jgi:hypothetical protein
MGMGEAICRGRERRSRGTVRRTVWETRQDPDAELPSGEDNVVLDIEVNVAISGRGCSGGCIHVGDASVDIGVRVCGWRTCSPGTVCNAEAVYECDERSEAMHTLPFFESRS